MPDNKRQHYVPKSTLRRFACDPGNTPEPRRINLVNIKGNKVIRGASLKEQCYRDYFYGKDLSIEHGLAHLEGVFTSLTDKIVTSLQLQERDGWHLGIMMMLQRSRTFRAEQEFNGMVDKLTKLALHNTVPDQDLRGIKVTIKDAARSNVGLALPLSPLLLDLKRFLVLNETDVPFVISDTPVLSTNWFGRTRDPHRSGGLARSGLQLLMPLSPQVALLMHDGNVYSTDCVNGIIKLRRSEEVVALNELQWLNAHQNLYFAPGFDDINLQALMNVTRPRRDLATLNRADHIGNGVYVPNNRDEFAPPMEGITNEIVRLSTDRLSRDVRLNCIRIRNKPVFHDDGTLASPRRDPAWASIVSEFADMVRAGRTTMSEFWDYVAIHQNAPGIGSWLARAKRRSDIEWAKER